MGGCTCLCRRLWRKGISGWWHRVRPGGPFDNEHISCPIAVLPVFLHLLDAPSCCSPILSTKSWRLSARPCMPIWTLANCRLARLQLLHHIIQQLDGPSF